MVFSLLELLDHVAKRPWMFVGVATFATIQAYLRGLAAGLDLAGIKYSWDEYIAAAESRGWNPRGNIGIVSDFTEKGLSDEEMVQELIAVEANAYSRVLARLSADGGYPIAGPENDDRVG